MKSLKQQFRNKIRAELAKVPLESIETQSVLVCQKVLQLAEYQSASKVSIFLSMPTEINTKLLVEDILNSGKTLFVPVCTTAEMRMVKVESIRDYQQLPLNSWNIPEPSLSEGRIDCFQAGGLDLVIMPGLAFDSAGNRIGYGRGYYDKFLAKMRDYSLENRTKMPTTGTLF